MPAQVSDTPVEQVDIIRDVFIQDPYYGNADEALFQWLTHNELQFRQGGTGPLGRMYGKFGACANSSGTGKSRTLIEVCI